MKKIVYIAPEVKVKALYMEQLMAGSGVTADDQGIGYGGVDDGGSMVPDAKSDLTINSVWDD
ncbi:MAG: hypothetical protein K6C10_12270 [Prevotella sp.]|nr:hypothetical protein [Prevotella sp.]